MRNIFLIIQLFLVFQYSFAQKKPVSNFSEQYRPQFHFSPPAHWMNDPNGLVYYAGEYHLFYQYYPDSTVWGPMHWGHAVSKDLFHWQHLPVALYPDQNGYIFSGSVVVDKKNTSRLGTRQNPAMIAVFTYHDPQKEKMGRKDYQSQGLAYSLDKGRTWIKYKNNPVLNNPGVKDFRDPKVSWYENEQKWIMSLAVGDHIRFYSSKNLLNWQFESDFGKGIGAHGGVWECPDLFPLKVHGSKEEKWVLLVSINPGGVYGGSGTQYFTGDFDGKTFTLDKNQQEMKSSKGVWIDYGKDNYAGVSWTDAPVPDGKRLFLGWMSNWEYGQKVPSLKWRSAMTVPRLLGLIKTPQGLRLHTSPVDLQPITSKTLNIPPVKIKDTLYISRQLNLKDSLFSLQLLLDSVQVGTDFTLELSNNKGQKLLIGYESGGNRYFIDRRNAGSYTFSSQFPGIHYGPKTGPAKLFNIRVLLDVSSVELFADGGKLAMTDLYFAGEAFSNVKFYSSAPVHLRSAKVLTLKSAWR